MTEDEFRRECIEDHFPNPATCFEQLVHRFGTEETGGLPAYLFRGEARYYPTSPPTTYRTIAEPLSMGVKFARIDITAIFVEAAEDHGLSEPVAEGLAQHYLCASDGLDFSASLGIALAFALGDVPARKGVRYVGVVPFERAMDQQRFHLHDLRHVRGALRPSLQHGFVAVHQPGDFTDLKDSSCRAALGLNWYSFDATEGDVTKGRISQAPSLSALYDASQDSAASFMARYLTDAIENPSEQWEEDGVAELKGALNRLQHYGAR